MNRLSSASANGHMRGALSTRRLRCGDTRRMSEHVRAAIIEAARLGHGVPLEHGPDWPVGCNWCTESVAPDGTPGPAGKAAGGHHVVFGLFLVHRRCFVTPRRQA